jgi:hypothetical protein
VAVTRVANFTINLSVAVIGLIAAFGSSCGNGHASVSSTAGGSSAASRSSTDPMHPPLSQTFNSPLMGYTVDYPAGWTATPATDLWVPDASNLWDDPVGDRLESSVAGFRGTSQLLGKGESAEQWVRDYMALEPTGCGKREQVPVDGQVGTIGLNGCAGQGRLRGKVFDLVVVSGNRGYNFTMEGKVDRDILLAMLATVKLDPQSAKKPP